MHIPTNMDQVPDEQSVEITRLEQGTHYRRPTTLRRRPSLASYEESRHLTT